MSEYITKGLSNFCPPPMYPFLYGFLPVLIEHTCFIKEPEHKETKIWANAKECSIIACVRCNVPKNHPRKHDSCSHINM